MKTKYKHFAFEGEVCNWIDNHLSIKIIAITQCSMGFTIFYQE